MRNCFRRLEDAGINPIGVAQTGDSHFYDAIEPALSRPGLPDLTRVMYQLWLERGDLRAAFSLDNAEGRSAYVHWFVESAQPEEQLDDASVTAAAALIGGQVGRPKHAAAIGSMRPVRPPWSTEEPWHGAACEADVYLTERIQFTIPTGPVELPRQMAILWERRADLQAAFALATGKEFEAYIAWCLTDGISGGQITPELLDLDFCQGLDTPSPCRAFTTTYQLLRRCGCCIPIANCTTRSCSSREIAAAGSGSRCGSCLKRRANSAGRRR
jgi:hypothetical protein